MNMVRVRVCVCARCSVHTLSSDPHHRPVRSGTLSPPHCPALALTLICLKGSNHQCPHCVADTSPDTTPSWDISLETVYGLNFTP